MDRWPNYPVVYEINTAAWLTDLRRRFDRPITLGTVPQAELDRLAGSSFDAVWLMGVWQRSEQARDIARTLTGLQAEYRHALPDYREEDCLGSPYAIHAYRVDPQFGGDSELAALRHRLAVLGIRLILDFVPNHLAVDHPWLTEYPERFVHGTSITLQHQPGEYFLRQSATGRTVFAHGRDRYYIWTDTAQLDYRHPETRQVMAATLLELADRCDGVRCDMAMLVLRDVFLGQWGGTLDQFKDEFWNTAILAVKDKHRDFLFVGEVYWGLEYALQTLGFDYTYDRRLYERLLAEDIGAVREHLHADIQFQRRLLRFIENHDEPRAAAAFGLRKSKAAAAAALTLPGMRLIHQGQMDGSASTCPVQLQRCRLEPAPPDVAAFYQRLLAVLHHPILHEGEWQLLEPKEAWNNNPTYRNFIAGCWTLEATRYLVAVNLAEHRSQCFLPLNFSDLPGRNWRLIDLLDTREYLQSGDDLATRGLYVELDAHDYHLFDFQPSGDATCDALSQ